MKSVKSRNLYGSRSIQLAKNHVRSFEAQTLQIHCIQGLIWVTWPDGNDRVLKKGRAIQVVSKGRICIQAFAAGAIIVKNLKSGHFVSRAWNDRRPANIGGAVLDCSNMFLKGVLGDRLTKQQCRSTSDPVC